MNPPPGSVRRFTDAASNAGVCAGVTPEYAVSTAATRMGMARNRAIVPVLATVRPSRTSKHGDQRKVAAHLMVKSAFRLLSKTDFSWRQKGKPCLRCLGTEQRQQCGCWNRSLRNCSPQRSRSLATSARLALIESCDGWYASCSVARHPLETSRSAPLSVVVVTKLRLSQRAFASGTRCRRTRRLASSPNESCRHLAHWVQGGTIT